MHHHLRGSIASAIPLVVMDKTLLPASDHWRTHALRERAVDRVEVLVGLIAPSAASLEVLEAHLLVAQSRSEQLLLLVVR